MDFSQFSALATQYAKENGIKDYELYYQTDSSDQLGAFSGEIDRMSGASVEGVSVTCFVDGRGGSASTENLTEEEIPALFARAAEAAKFGAPGCPFSGSESYEALEEPETVQTDTAREKELILSAGTRAQKLDSRIEKGVTAGVAVVSIRRAIANSSGLFLSGSGGMTVFSTGVVAKDENGRRYNGYSVQAYRSLSEVDADAVVRRAVEKTVSQIGASPVPSGKYPVIFDASQMTQLLEIFSSAFSARQVQEGLSLLSGKLNQPVASEWVTLIDDPFYPGNFFPAAFDAEGVRTYRKNIVENGLLKTYFYDRSAAEKDHTESTGNAYRESYDSPVSIAPFTFYMKPGTMSREELLKKAGRAVMITFMKGAHAGANAVTGDFSLESKGFLIEDGKIVRPVEEITVAGNFYQLLKDITAVANDLKVNAEDGMSCCGAPTVLVSSLAVAGN